MPAWCMIVPCFNEARRVDGEAFGRFTLAEADAHFLFVNDGSTDDTRGMIDALVAKYPERIRLLDLPGNVGKAEAVRAGANDLARWKAFEYAGYMDADLSTPLEGISDLRAAIDRGTFEFALGSRVKLLGRRIERNITRHYLGRIFATATSVMLNLPVYDTQCGAKFFRSTLIPEIFTEPFRTRWFFDVEILFRILKARGRDGALKVLVEVPVLVWVERGGSKITATDVLKTPVELARIWLHYRRRNSV